MKMTVRIRLIICFCFALNMSQAQNTYSFFSQEDIQDIKNSSQTEWGKAIVNALLAEVENRRQHALRVPLLEGGHLHHYFCPVHNEMLEFDWDNSHKHYCKSCNKYWENNNRFDWAWINVLHSQNLKYLTACTYLYLATNHPDYATYIKDMLLDYAAKYPFYFEHNPDRKATSLNSGRMFGQSLDEAVWASDAAKAFSVIKHTLTPDEIKKIEKGYLEVCAEMLLNRRGGGNWQVWHNSGLIALGIALGNDSIVDVALNDPQCGYHQLMRVHVYDDGWWNEGSPIYHYYPLRAILLSAEAVRGRGIDLYDEKLHNMLASPARGVYADLSFPAHNDGWYGESLIDQVKLYEIAYRRYAKDSFFRDILQRCYQYTERCSVEALFNNEDIVSGKLNQSLPSVSFENLGVAVIRSDNRSVVLKYGPHGGGHGHPDKLSISIHNGEKELVSDMGTSAYGVPDFVHWYRKTLSHSTVTVDAQDQKETTGQLIRFEPAVDGGSVDARVQTAYPGIEMSRKLDLKGNILTDVFSAVSSAKHTYDYVLILTEKPTLNGQGSNVELSDADVYKRIANVKKYANKKTVKISLEGGSQIDIQSLGKNGFTVFTGEAPGIPPKNPESKEHFVSSVSYPLIIRTYDDSMKIRAKWVIR